MTLASSTLIRIACAALLGGSSLAGLGAELTVSAAASLTNVFRELGSAFEARNADTTVVFNFGGSDALLTQITRGAPADVFASADTDVMDRAEAKKLLVPGSRRNFAGNTLVLITGLDGRLGIKTLADLQRAEVRRVAIGNPASVPVGRYAKHALEAAKLLATVEAKTVNAQSARQVLDYVARGEVEAGFVYATDAAVLKHKVRVVATVPTETAITYPIAAVAGRPNADAARRFVDFVLAPAAQAVLARHGFGRP
jgi:molybdate transport system substrate-binding protein